MSRDIENDVESSVKSAAAEYDERFIETVRSEVLFILTRVLEITYRFFQYRVRELLVRGIELQTSSSSRITLTDYGAPKIIFKIELTLPEHFWRRYIESYAEYVSKVRKLMRSARIKDRHKYVCGCMTRKRGRLDLGYGGRRSETDFTEEDRGEA